MDIAAEITSPSGVSLPDVTVSFDDGSDVITIQKIESGLSNAAITNGSDILISGSLDYVSSSKSISSQDALDALRLAVGMDTQNGSSTAFDYIAADFNQDGKVTSSDALEILKYAVGLPTTEQAEWVFVDTNGDYSGVGKSNTNYTEGVSIGDLSLIQGKEVLGYITQLSPNVRKYRQGKDAGLADLASLPVASERVTLTPQTQARILKQMSQFLDWCVGEGELEANPWKALKVKERPEVNPHEVLKDEQVSILLSTKDRVLHNAFLFGLLTGMRSGEICGLMAEDIISKGNLGRFVSIRPNRVRLLKSKAAEREVPLHGVLERLLDTALPKSGRLFPYLTVDKAVKRYAKLRQRNPELHGTVFHSTRKWFITQCERTGVPEHFTATLVGHHAARSANKLTYGLYSAGISDAQKRGVVDQIRLPTELAL